VNENCLEGLECPKCGNHDELDIAAIAWLRVVDKGTGDYKDPEWNDGSACRCPRCGYVATVASFRDDPDAATGGSYDDADDLTSGVDLEGLTGKKWEEVEGRDTKCGIDYYFESVDGTLAAWVNHDQGWVTLKIVSLVADADDVPQGFVSCGQLVPSQVDHYHPNLVFEMQGNSEEIPWLR
jgi:hypothetical protein